MRICGVIEAEVGEIAVETNRVRIRSSFQGAERGVRSALDVLNSPRILSVDYLAIVATIFNST